MERRELIQKAAGFGLLAGLLPSETVLASQPSHKATATEPGPNGDRHTELTNRIATLEKGGGGTLELSDGVYEISKPLRLPISVSLVMTPNAVLRAKQGFQGDAVLIKGGGSKSKYSETSGWIRGGIIDGGRQSLTGIRVEAVERLEIADLVVVNATYKGIHLLKGGYEKNITRVRCDVDLHTKYAPGSIGLHYENGDSKVILAHIIGYETGVRSESTGAGPHRQVVVMPADMTTVPEPIIRPLGPPRTGGGGPPDRRGGPPRRDGRGGGDRRSGPPRGRRHP